MMKTDNLILEAKTGNSEAFKKLFNQYKPVVFALQQKYFLRDLDSEDWLQEGRIIFFQVLQRYEAERGATLGKFFKLAFCNHILSLLRKQNAMKRRTALLSSSLEALVEKDDSFGMEQTDDTPSPLDRSSSSNQYKIVFVRYARYKPSSDNCTLICSRERITTRI